MQSAYLNEPFSNFELVGISLDCTREQFKICHIQCVYIIVARAEADLHNLALDEKTPSTVQTRLEYKEIASFDIPLPYRPSAEKEIVLKITKILVACETPQSKY